MRMIFILSCQGSAPQAFCAFLAERQAWSTWSAVAAANLLSKEPSIGE